MRVRLRFLFSFLLAAMFAAPFHLHAEDLNSVLQRLNAAAKNFHTVSASVEFDSVTLDPILDHDIRKGTAFYQRNGGSFKMAAHFNVHNDKPGVVAYNYTGGSVHFFDGTEVHTYAFSKWESYLILGFGASGTELQEKWEIKYLGSEKMDGVDVAKLELVAKDPAVRKNIQKITIWIDPDKGVSHKQRFDENASSYRICTYSNIKINEPLPKNAFDLK